MGAPRGAALTGTVRAAATDMRAGTKRWAPLGPNKKMTDRIYEDKAMVASISARGGVQAALGYYGHLGRDDYYTRGPEPLHQGGFGDTLQTLLQHQLASDAQAIEI